MGRAVGLWVDQCDALAAQETHARRRGEAYLVNPQSPARGLFWVAPSAECSAEAVT